MELDIKSVEAAWKREVDACVVKAATKDLNNYSPEVQSIIEAEAKHRGFWEKVLFLRGEATTEPISENRNIVGYVCDRCRGTILNFETGRCAECSMPSLDMGYCLGCDKFYPILPGQNCPVHNKALSKSKFPNNWFRLGNHCIDHIFIVISIPFLIYFPFFLVITNYIPPIIFNLIYIFLYYFIFEALFQRTPAKWILGNKVVNAVGERASLSAIAKRTLIRFIPFEPFSFFTGENSGVHDRWSRTYVIKAKRFGRKKL